MVSIKLVFLKQGMCNDHLGAQYPSLAICLSGCIVCINYVHSDAQACTCKCVTSILCRLSYKAFVSHGMTHVDNLSNLLVLATKSPCKSDLV